MKEQENKVYRASDGTIAYDGPTTWRDLTDDQRTERIKECYLLSYCTYKQIAEILRVFLPSGRGNAEAISSHLRKFRIDHPKVVSKPPTPISARRNVMSFSGPGLHGEKQQERIRTQTAFGKAVVAKAEQNSLPTESYMDKLKKQKGFCVAVRGDGEYCGEDTGSLAEPRCKGHRSGKPDFRGRIWMKLPAS